MEYICTIYKNTSNITYIIFGCTYSLKLPLFSLKTEPVSFIADEYGIYFQKEDRYSPNLIYVHPPKELTEEQFRIINEKWNYCVENNLLDYEFEL